MIKLLEKELQGEYEEKYTKDFIKELDLRSDIKFIPLCYDPMFKKVFGNNKKILKKFLMKVLHLDIKEDQCRMAIGVNELPKEQDKNYGSRVDINVIINDTIRINLEVNQEVFKDIADRNFLFASKMHTLNVESGTKYKDFYKYETIQLNLNTHHYGTEINGEDIFYIKSENTGNRLVNNFKIVIKDLAYFHNLYYTKNGKCDEDQIWLAMLMSGNFTELNDFLEVLLKKEERQHFLKEVINMCENEFFLHEWEPEAMKQIVEGRKAYNREQERLEDEKRKKEIDIRKKEIDIRKKEIDKREVEIDKREVEIECTQKKLEYDQKELKAEQNKLEAEQNKLEAEQNKLEAEQKKMKQEKEKFEIKTIKSLLLTKKLSYQEIKDITNKSIEEIKEIEKSLQD